MGISQGLIALGVTVANAPPCRVKQTTGGFRQAWLPQVLALLRALCSQGCHGTPLSLAFPSCRTGAMTFISVGPREVLRHTQRSTFCLLLRVCSVYVIAMCSLSLTVS